MLTHVFLLLPPLYHLLILPNAPSPVDPHPESSIALTPSRSPQHPGGSSRGCARQIPGPLELGGCSTRHPARPRLLRRPHPSLRPLLFMPLPNPCRMSQKMKSRYALIVDDLARWAGWVHSGWSVGRGGMFRRRATIALPLPSTCPHAASRAPRTSSGRWRGLARWRAWSVTHGSAAPSWNSIGESEEPGGRRRASKAPVRCGVRVGGVAGHPPGHTHTRTPLPMPSSPAQPSTAPLPSRPSLQLAC